jgi:alkanesulfonate monooxygenase SsuD/methylene tetrahydromethanopterin reductase-like flavin-dependent oxidoreductase (luciferase family)
VRHRRHIPLGAGLYTVGEPVAWAHRDAQDLIDFDAHRHFVTAAEAAKLDFMFYGEDLSVGESNGRVLEPYSAGRLDSVILYGALAATTTKIGLMATVNATFSNPYELASQIGSLAAISGGRAGWNVVTSANATTAANFSHADLLPREQRYQWAAEFVHLTNGLWASPTTGMTYHGRYFDVSATAALSVDPRSHPVLMQSGESDAGRDFASEHADLVFTGFESVEKGQLFYSDLTRRIADRGRAADGVKIMGSAFVHVGETDRDATDEFAELRNSMMTPGMVRNYLGRYWGRDLSGYDVHGPLPSVEPDWQVAGEYTKNRIRGERDPRKAVAELKAIAEHENLSMAELVPRVFDDTMATIVGSPTTVADIIEDAVDRRAVDGFVLTSALQPHGMDRFYELVLPILRERGRFREEYTGQTLRDHLDLSA